MGRIPVAKIVELVFGIGKQAQFHITNADVYVQGAATTEPG